MGFPNESTQFKPGQSGNPNGYSRGRRITDKLLELIAEKNADKALANVWLTAALKGNFQFFKEMLDRIEGKVPEPEPSHSELDEAHDDISALRDYLDKHQLKPKPGPDPKRRPAGQKVGRQPRTKPGV